MNWFVKSRKPSVKLVPSNNGLNVHLTMDSTKKEYNIKYKELPYMALELSKILDDNPHFNVVRNEAGLEFNKVMENIDINFQKKVYSKAKKFSGIIKL